MSSKSRTNLQSQGRDHPRVAAVGAALPAHYYSQEDLIAEFRQHWVTRHHNLARLEALHRNVQVRGRHLALPLEAYPSLSGFTEANDAFIRCAVDLGERAIRDSMERAGLGLETIAHLFCVSVTGIAVPSVDARILNRLGLRGHVKRTPIFGLGCVAGAAGVARAADYLRAFPGEVAVILSVELCSLTLQARDLSVANIIASGLFGDGAAAAVLVGADRETSGPEILTSRSIFYPDSERLMGWDVTSDGLKVVLSADVPRLVEAEIGSDVDRFLSDCGLTRAEIGSYVCHPGGPRVIQALQKALDLPDDALALTWESLRSLGNLSSASVLMVLRDTLGSRRPPKGTYGLMIAMGPGFCAELVLLRW